MSPLRMKVTPRALVERSIRCVIRVLSKSADLRFMKQRDAEQPNREPGVVIFCASEEQRERQR